MNQTQHSIKHLLATAAAVTLGSSAIAQVGGMQQGTGWRTSDQVVKGAGNDGPARPASPPIDFSKYKPMPFPAPKPGNAHTLPGKGAFQFRDTRTGAISSLPESAIPKRNEIGAWQEGSVSEGSFEGRSFGTLSEVTNPDYDPARRNVKLYMEFPDGFGGTDYFVASGTLISPKHVLTAGHCVYNDTTNQWASKITVYPALDDGQASQWGSATSVGVWSFTGWSTNEDLNWDMGGVILDRPVGALTSWMGYGYTTNCSFFETTPFYNFSYPAESAYGFDGNTMWSMSGTWDDGCVDSNLVEMNKMVYKGMSGSGAYALIDTSRYVYAVCSHRWIGGPSRYAKMWQNMFTYIRDTRIPADSPDTVNFRPLQVRTSNATVDAGATLPDFSYYVHNDSDASFNGVVGVDVYLSTNDTISTGDDKLGGYGFNFVANPKSTIHINYDASLAPRIPKDTPTGNYYLGLITTNADAVAGDNDSSGQDALAIHVVGHPDIDVTSVVAQNGTFNQGRTMDVTYSLKNIGGMLTTGYNVKVYASTNTAITSLDTLLDTFTTTVDLAPAGTRTIARTVTIPAALAAGTYYIGVVVDSDTAESDVTNNTGYDATTVNITDLSDLEVQLVDSTDGSYVPGATVPVHFVVKNTGTEAVTGWTAKFYLSTNTIISASDTLVKTLSLGTLNPGSTRDATTSFSVPAGTTNGHYYVGLIVSTAQSEVSTANNDGYDATRITVADCPADYNGDGFANGDDYDAFVNDFELGNSKADYNGDGFVTGDDFDAFVDAFVAGC